MNILTTIIAAGEEYVSAWKLLVSNLGVPGALMGVFILALHKRWIVMGKEVERNDKDCAEKAEDLKIQAAKTESIWVQRVGDLEEEKDMWRGMALRNAGIAEGAIETAHKAAKKLTEDNK